MFGVLLHRVVFGTGLIKTVDRGNQCIRPWENMYADECKTPLSYITSGIFFKLV